MTFLKHVLCPVRWKCFRTGNTVDVDLKAVCNTKYGWIYECGEWVKDSDYSHEILLWGERDGYRQQ